MRVAIVGAGLAGLAAAAALSRARHEVTVFEQADARAPAGSRSTCGRTRPRCCLALAYRPAAAAGRPAC